MSRWTQEALVKYQLKRRRGEDRACAGCGKVFYVQRARIEKKHETYTCSKDCQALVSKKVNAPNCKCEVCGIWFFEHECNIKSGRGKFCSKACLLKKPKASYGKCERCGVEIKIGAKRFCSRACSGAAQRTIEDRKCETCGIVFRPRPGDKGRFCSLSCCGAEKSKNASIHRGSGKGGRRADLNNRYFRSRWEANYARYLNWLVKNKQIAGWEFEPDTYEFHKIKKGMRFYTPDFKVFEIGGHHVYHEVKGYLTSEGRTKLKRMASYYPNEKVLLIDKPVYTSIARQFSKMLPHWESATRKDRP